MALGPSTIDPITVLSTSTFFSFSRNNVYLYLTFDPWTSVRITSYGCSLPCNKGDYSRIDQESRLANCTIWCGAPTVFVTHNDTAVRLSLTLKLHFCEKLSWNRARSSGLHFSGPGEVRVHSPFSLGGRGRISI